jgi:hypothetical protein
MGMDHLLGVMRDLLENCLVPETTDWQLGAELKQVIHSISDDHNRKRLGAILETLAKRDRFLPILAETSGAQSIADAALANRDAPHLDLIITENGLPHPSGRSEVTSLARFNASDFAARRSNAARGVVLEGGEYKAIEFFQKYFSRLLLVAESFDIWDYALGKYGFGDNYPKNLEWWVGFLSGANHRVRLTIHTVDNKLPAVRRCLGEYCEDTTVDFEVKGYEYEKLPHERYLVTPQYTFDIGRGVDLIDLATGRNRDIRIALSPKVTSPLLTDQRNTPVDSSRRHV